MPNHLIQTETPNGKPKIPINNEALWHMGLDRSLKHHGYIAMTTTVADLLEFTSKIMEVLDLNNTIEHFQGLLDRQLYKVKLDNVPMRSTSNSSTMNYTWFSILRNNYHDWDKLYSLDREQLTWLVKSCNKENSMLVFTSDTTSKKEGKRQITPKNPHKAPQKTPISHARSPHNGRS
jgi:hypothetical protein